MCSSICALLRASYPDQFQLRVEIYEFACELNEEVTSVASLPLKARTGTSKETPSTETSFLIVGTTYEQGKPVPEKGRLLVFEQTSVEERKMRLVVSLAVKGCVYALAGCGGNFVAAVNSGVCRSFSSVCSF